MLGIAVQHATHHVSTCGNDFLNLPWTVPSLGRVKLNTDGSFSDGIGGAGMVLRDHLGSIIFTSCRHLPFCYDVLEAELRAIMEGLMLSLQWSTLPIDIESDCLQGVSMVQSKESNRSKYAPIVLEIKEYMKERNSCITHIRRSQNIASHYMANFGRTSGRTTVWLGSGPEDVVNVCERDCNP